MQDIRVMIGGRGYDAQDVIISGARSTKQAKEWTKARYPGCKIFGTQVVGGTAEERDYSDWGTCKGPRNPHGTKTIPDSTFTSSNNGGSQSTSSSYSSSGGSGCLGLLLGVVVVIGLIGNVIGGGTTDAPESAPAAPVTTVTEDYDGITPENCARFLTATECGMRFSPSTPAELKTPCAIWADANPTLAARLTPGDTCYGL